MRVRFPGGTGYRQTPETSGSSKAFVKEEMEETGRG
jgi:hypothetical protein